MKTVILAGGFGTRLSEYTSSIPKPMVAIGGRPILWHIMQIYASYGHTDFILALGYKAEIIRDYFVNFQSLSGDCRVDLGTGEVTFLKPVDIDWTVSLIDTGLQTMTGGRVKRLSSILKNEPFMLTYGDGLSSVDINKLIDFHKSHGKLVTVSAVHPAARFGELTLEGETVKAFLEKPQVQHGWINGGYFVCEPEFLDLIDEDQTVLEKEPLERAAKAGQLMAYRHDGFWQCMDTKRDRDALEDLWVGGHAPWIR